jgi:hypothetical protein
MLLYLVYPMLPVSLDCPNYLTFIYTYCVGIFNTCKRQTKENHTTICVGHQGYTRHKRKTNTGKPHHNMCWIPRVYKTQEKDKPTHIVVWFSFVCLSPVLCMPLVSNTYCGVVFLCSSFSCILYTLCCQFL